MSTRVQKGGTIFKPVAKPRARFGSEVRQTSVAPDSRLSLGPSSAYEGRHDPSNAPPQSGDSASSMPPPATVPQKTLQASPSRTTDPTLSELARHTDRESGASPITIPSRSTIRPPTIRSTPQPQALPRSASEAPTAVSISIPSQDHTFRPPSMQPTTQESQVVASTPITSPATASREFWATQNVNEADSHIDPALIKAVISALRQADQSQSQESITAQTETQTIAQGPTDTTNQQFTPASGTDTDALAASSQHKRTRAKPAQQPEGLSPTPQENPEGQLSNVLDEEAQDSDTTNGKKRKRKGTGVPRKRRSRPPSLPPYDPDADPGEEIDPTAVTMAELCEDTGRGRVSSKAAAIVNNHAAWRAANRERRAQMRARAEATKYGRNPDEESGDNPPSTEGASQNDPSVKAASGPSSRNMSRAQSVDPEASKGDGFDYSQTMSTSKYNVQVRIGPSGETIIDETSLVVDRHEEEDTSGYTHIEESDTTKFINSATYSKRLRGSRWSVEETDLFYEALSQFGENYELISLVLPGRDRKACKNKFKAEDKRDPGRITHCLKNRRPYDIATLSRMTGKDFSGPTPEIRAPTPLRMPKISGSPAGAVDIRASPPIKQASTLAPDEEILGDVEEMTGEIVDYTVI